MKIFETENFDDFIKRVEGRDLEVSTEIYNKIMRGYKRGFKKVKVFTVSLSGGDHFDFEIDRDEWSKALNTCLEVFAENDMFEECIEITTVLKELKV